MDQRYNLLVETKKEKVIFKDVEKHFHDDLPFSKGKSLVIEHNDGDFFEITIIQIDKVIRITRL